MAKKATASKKPQISNKENKQKAKTPEKAKTVENDDFVNEDEAKAGTAKTTENQKGRIMERQHFDLVSIKVKDGKVDLSYFNKLFPNILEKPSMSVAPHPDLQSKLDELKLIFATKTGLLHINDTYRDNEHVKANSDILKIVLNLHDEIIKSVKITGIAISSEGETRGVNIKGYVKFPKKGGDVLNSGIIHFDKEVFGIEEELQEICNEIEGEAYKYRVLKKYHQMEIDSKPDLFNGSEED